MSHVVVLLHIVGVLVDAGRVRAFVSYIVDA